MKRFILLLSISLILFSCGDDDSDLSGPSIVVEHNGIQVNELFLNQLKHNLSSRELSLYDQLHRKQKNYRVFELADLLRHFYTDSLNTAAASLKIQFRALDGYTVEAPLSQMLEDGGYLAFEDLDVEGEANWEIIVPERSNNPAPYYIVWSGEDQDPFDSAYPWPYQLRTINLED